MKKYLCLGVVAIMSMMILGACDSNQENNTTNDLPQENNQQADVSQTDIQQTATYECISQEEAHALMEDGTAYIGVLQKWKS